MTGDWYDSNNYVKILSYDEEENLEYQGTSIPGAISSASVWQIRKFFWDEEGKFLGTKFAEGSPRFDKIWDIREEYDYL